MWVEVKQFWLETLVRVCMCLWVCLAGWLWYAIKILLWKVWSFKNVYCHSVVFPIAQHLLSTVNSQAFWFSEASDRSRWYKMNHIISQGVSSLIGYIISQFEACNPNQISRHRSVILELIASISGFYLMSNKVFLAYVVILSLLVIKVLDKILGSGETSVGPL